MTFINIFKAILFVYPIIQVNFVISYPRASTFTNGDVSCEDCSNVCQSVNDFPLFKPCLNCGIFWEKCDKKCGHDDSEKRKREECKCKEGELYWGCQEAIICNHSRCHICESETTFFDIPTTEARDDLNHTPSYDFENATTESPPKAQSTTTKEQNHISTSFEKDDIFCKNCSYVCEKLELDSITFANGNSPNKINTCLDCRSFWQECDQKCPHDDLEKQKRERCKCEERKTTWECEIRPICAHDDCEVCEYEEQIIPDLRTFSSQHFTVTLSPPSKVPNEIITHLNYSEENPLMPQSLSLIALNESINATTPPTNGNTTTTPSPPQTPKTESNHTNAPSFDNTTTTPPLPQTTPKNESNHTDIPSPTNTTTTPPLPQTTPKNESNHTDIPSPTNTTIETTSTSNNFKNSTTESQPPQNITESPSNQTTATNLEISSVDSASTNFTTIALIIVAIICLVGVFIVLRKRNVFGNNRQFSLEPINYSENSTYT